jgi:hypothetical protein
MIYFIHDVTSRAIKIGCARDPQKRRSALQISTSNKLVLLGAIAGTERTEKKVHALVDRHCAPKPGESFTRPLRLNGEWFDDRILPFVTELMKAPKEFLDVDKKKPTERLVPVNRDLSIHSCKLVLSFDSGEEYHEALILKAASPDLALAALVGIANARLAFLANTVQITALTVPGCPTKQVSLRGAFVTQKCFHHEGLSVIVNSEPGNCYSTIRGVKQYAFRRFHGVPHELCKQDSWGIHPTAQFQALLSQFAKVLTDNQCLICARNPLVIRGLMPRGIGILPNRELRSKVNKKAASNRRKQRPPEKAAVATIGIVYFIQDTVTLAIKIGFCLGNPEKRLAALRTGNSNTLKLLGHIAGTLLHETNLHAQFAPFHIQGEWFSGSIIGQVEGILKYQSVEDWLKAQEPVLQEQGEWFPGSPGEPCR